MSDTKINNQAKGIMGYKFPVWRAHCHTGWPLTGAVSFEKFFLPI